MGARIYKQRDIVPIIVQVLDLVAYFYASIAFKFAVKDHFQDLRNMVSTDDLDDESVELLRQLNSHDPLIKMICSVVESIMETKDLIANIYNIQQDFLRNPTDRIMQLAENFYWSLVIDNFPEDGEEDQYDEVFYTEQLLLHIASIVSVIHCLLDMLCFGKVNLIRFSEQGNSWRNFHKDEYRDIEYADAFQLLLQLEIEVMRHDNAVFWFMHSEERSFNRLEPGSG